MPRLLTETADYDEPGSWGRASDGWPCIRGSQAYHAYVFANCCATIPYGSYVFIADRKELRVHPEHIHQLQLDFHAANYPTAKQSVKRREETGPMNRSGNRDRAPKWW